MMISACQLLTTTWLSMTIINLRQGCALLIFIFFFLIQNRHNLFFARGHEQLTATILLFCLLNPFPALWTSGLAFEDLKSRANCLTHQMLNPNPAVIPPNCSQLAKWQLWTLNRFNNNSLVCKVNYQSKEFLPVLLNVCVGYRQKTDVCACKYTCRQKYSLLTWNYNRMSACANILSVSSLR